MADWQASDISVRPAPSTTRRLLWSLLIGLPALAFLLLLALRQDAAAVDANVSAVNYVFLPNTVNIDSGDRVTFNRGSGTHQVVFTTFATSNIPLGGSSTSGTTSPFNSPGIYYFYCEVHANAVDATEQNVQGGIYMVGKVVVTGGGPAPTDPAPTATDPAPTSTEPGPTVPIPTTDHHNFVPGTTRD